MHKTKLTVKKVPNVDEMALQYRTSNPLEYIRDSESSDPNILGEDYKIGTAYPEEKKEDANIEAEKGELILTRDYELFKIHGKSHKKGGTPIAANPGDFIFSKKLEIGGELIDKTFGKFDPKKSYSFADVANKFIDLNQYKVLMESKNPLDRQTGEKMYQEYQDKLGLLAFVQEASKGLPNGIPSISTPALERMTKQPMTEEGTPTASSTLMKKGGAVLMKYAKTGEVNPFAFPWDPFAVTGLPMPELPPMEPPYQEIVKKNEVFDTNKAVKRPGNTNWQETYYQPTLEFLTMRGIKRPEFANHEDYQKTVAENPELRAILLNKIKTGAFPITNKGRDMLVKAGVMTREQAYKSGTNAGIGTYEDLPAEYQQDEQFLIDQYIDGIPGHRGLTKTDFPVPEQRIDGRIIRTQTGVEQPFAPKLDLGPQGTPAYAPYRDLGYNTNEHAVMLNSLGAMSSIPYFPPTRNQNYGLQQALGIASNVQPYNYQSLINESNRSGFRGYQANNTFSPNASIASARNALIAGTLAENTSKIKGEEYNQNANLYNNNQMQIANLASQIGADKEQQGDLYNTRVVQGRENFWANKKMANKEFLQEFANANNNRAMRNTVDYLMASRDPNYRFRDANLSAGFVNTQDPFAFLNAFSTIGTPPQGRQSDATMQAEYQRLSQMFGDNKQLINRIMAQKFNLKPQSIDDLQ